MVGQPEHSSKLLGLKFHLLWTLTCFQPEFDKESSYLSAYSPEDCAQQAQSTVLQQNTITCQCRTSEILAEFRSILAEFRVALFISGTSASARTTTARTITRYLPHPTHHLPFRNTWDVQWLFSPEDILGLVKQQSILVIDECQIKSQMPEPEIAGAMERIEFQPGVFQQILHRCVWHLPLRI